MDKQISLSLSIPALQLILEGLAQLPLYKSKVLFDAIELETKRQLEATEVKECSDVVPAE